MSGQDRWPARQQAMLREMGLRLWLPPGETGAMAGAMAGATAGATAGRNPAASAAAPDRPAPPDPVAGLAPRPPARATTLIPALAGTALAGRPEPGNASSAASASGQAPDALDTLALQAAVAACSACGLCQTRRQAVWGGGVSPADCMVIGDPPDTDEDSLGLPFAGEAGQLLDRMLFAIGLSRQADVPGRPVFTTNVLKCSPPRNRLPSAAELAQCQPFLQRQVALVKPRVILAMGRFAVQSLLGGDLPVGKLRGRVHDWQGVPLVVTHHPAFLLRQPQCKAEAWQDLCLAAQLLDAESA